jgi:hypothetical protein
LGIGIEQLIMLFTFFFGLIICVKNYKIGAMIWTLLFFSQFAIFYELEKNSLLWVQPLAAWFISIMLLFLLIFMGFWRYEDRRKIIT